MSRMLLQVLDESEIEILHARALELLAKVGFKLTHDEALARFARAGARVDEASATVRLDPSMVTELLSLAPSHAVQTGLNGKRLDVGGDNRYYTALILDPFIADYEDGLRPPLLEDVRRHTIVGESLDRVDAMMRMQYPVADIPEPDSCYRTMELFLLHATKHIGAVLQMGRFYGLPVSGEAGGSLTWRPDLQNGAESFAFLLASHAGRQNIVGGLGSLHNANGMGAEQIVMQCGLVDMVEYLVSGVDMSEEKLAFDSILRAGPGGQYLEDELTLELLRSDEFFHSPHLDLSGGYDPSAPGTYERAHRTVEELVSSYRPTLSDEIVTAIRAFFREKYRDPSVADR